MATRLQILNHMLSVIGEGGVNDVSSKHGSAIQANRILDIEDTEFQTKGYWFNKEYDVLLEMDEDGRVPIPAGVLDFKIAKCILESSSPSARFRYIKQGNFVYDATEHTNVLNRTIRADLVFKRDIDDMPPVASNYLMRIAAEQMLTDDDGDLGKLQVLQRKTLVAKSAFDEAVLRTTGISALDTQAGLAMRSGIGQFLGSTNPRYPGGRKI